MDKTAGLSLDGNTTTPIWDYSTIGANYCPWCSQPHLGSYVYHGAACPKVKAIEYYPNGMIKRTEFFGEPPTQITEEVR